MHEAATNIGSSVTSIDTIITAIHATRNERIDQVLAELNVSELLETESGVFKLSSVKKEFLIRDLVELRATTLDLVHYASLINELKATNSNIPDSQHPLFLRQLRLVFNKYCK